MSGIMIIDDRNPSIVYNSGHWGLEENAKECNGTSTFCNIVGGTATFNFTGAHIIDTRLRWLTISLGCHDGPSVGPANISVFGVIQPSSFHASGRSSFTIDGDTQYIFTPPAGDRELPQFDVEFFSTFVGGVAGPHTLVITTLDGDNHFVYLDYIQVIQKFNTSKGRPKFTSIQATRMITTGLSRTHAAFSIDSSTGTSIGDITGVGSTIKASDTPSSSLNSLMGVATSAPEVTATPQTHRVSLVLIVIWLRRVCYARRKPRQERFGRYKFDAGAGWRKDSDSADGVSDGVSDALSDDVKMAGDERGSKLYGSYDQEPGEDDMSKWTPNSI
ncbi:hypothetical protein CPC08DRAFT_766817 [Agrocybe pediades]|nr:hypothetical protein CPC08DRAFT_766817 [Agrocybe pediades]